MQVSFLELLTAAFDDFTIKVLCASGALSIGLDQVCPFMRGSISACPDERPPTCLGLVENSLGRTLSSSRVARQVTWQDCSPAKLWPARMHQDAPPLLSDAHLTLAA